MVFPQPVIPITAITTSSGLFGKLAVSLKSDSIFVSHFSSGGAGTSRGSVFFRLSPGVNERPNVDEGSGLNVEPDVKVGSVNRFPDETEQPCGSGMPPAKLGSKMRPDLQQIWT